MTSSAFPYEFKFKWASVEMSKPGTMVYTILDRAVQFFQEPKNRERIQQNCLDPMLRYILDRMFPYIILTCILFSLILLMSLTSVGLLMFQLHMSSKQAMVQVMPAAANAATVAANAVSDIMLNQAPL